MPVCIYGHKVRLSNQIRSIPNSCPECRGTIVHGNAKKYFTLYYVPLFPYKDLGSTFQCQRCKKFFSGPSHQNLSSSSVAYQQQRMQSNQAYAREIESFYTTGMEAFKSGDYKESIEQFKSLLRLKSVPLEIRGVSYQILSRSYALREKWKGAIFYSDKLFTLGSEKILPAFVDHVLRIQAALAIGDEDKVSRTLEMARTRFGHKKEFKELEKSLAEARPAEINYFQIEEH